MSGRKKAAFALLAVALGLSSIEVASAIAERTVLTPIRTVPTPAPGTAAEVPALVVPPEAHLALTEDTTKRWGLPAGRTMQVDDTTHRINAAGMRGAELTPPRPGEIRLLTLGDSSIYGDGVTEAALLSRVAAGHLAAAWGCEVQDFNGGVPGYSSAQSLVRLRELGPLVAPQYVVAGPIWSDVYTTAALHRRDGVIDRGYTQGPLRRLATYRVLRTLMAPWLSARKVRWIDQRDDIAGTEAEATVQLRDYIDNLHAIADTARQLGAEPIFVVLPAPMDLDVAPVPETILEYRAAMAHVATQTGSALVDGPAWLEAEGGTLALFDDHVHPNALGHALLGYALAETIKAQPPPARCTP